MTYHIVVVGGGLSGCAAAVAAARRGARVVLLEPTHLLGGQMSAAGVGTADLAPGFATTVEQGLWGEIARRVRSIYSGLHLTAAVARYRLNDSMGVNAPIIDRVLTELCHEAGVEVLRNCPVTAASVTTDNVAVQTPIGTIEGSVAVEATEDGSLLALADFPFRAGAQTGRGMTLSGRPTAIQRITQCAVVRRYDNGIPAPLRLTRPPAAYDSVRSKIAGSYPGKPYGSTPNPTDNDFAGYRAYPDIANLVYYDALDITKITRTSLNHINEVAVDTDYLTDPDARRAANVQAIDYTLSVIYYLQNELNLNWAIAQDEGFREGPRPRSEDVTADMPDWVVDMPPIPYLRESRRLIGSYTLTGRRIKRPASDTPCAWSFQNLAVGTYMTDMHGSKGEDDFETHLGESIADVSQRRGPFIIPFGSFVPADDRRLVAAEKNLSMTRVASSAVRVHPSVTAVGEVAGVIAALAWRQGISPRSVSYKAAQISLLRGGAILLPYPTYGMPDGHADYPAVAMALLHGRVSYRLDDDAHVVRLTSSQMSAAKEIGRRLIAAWKGPL